SRMRARVLCVVIPALVACTGEPSPPTETTTTSAVALVANAFVVRIVDGDTIVADIDGRRTTVRLIGIDTPETVKPDSPVECFGPEASAYIGTLLDAGTPIRVERDAEARDDYGRLLAYIRRAADGLF